MRSNVTYPFLLSICVLLTIGTSLTSAHAHGVPLTEAERKASEGVFENIAVKDRGLSDWEGAWQSINPYLLNGVLDPVLEKKSQKGDKTIEEYRAYYIKGYATDIDMINIESDIIKFHIGDTVKSCHYAYSGFKILTYSSGKKGVRYLFECQDSQSKAPKYVQFSDHIIGPRKSEHFHIYTGDESQESLLNKMDNWPTYYPNSLNKEQILHEMLHH